MKQETIEDMRETLFGSQLARSFPTFVWERAEALDILAVLEAARDYKQADEELEFLANKGDGIPEDVFDRHGATHVALLALIDLSDDLRVLGGTK